MPAVHAHSPTATTLPWSLPRSTRASALALRWTFAMTLSTQVHHWMISSARTSS